MSELWTLDFEASGLNLLHTYPIEIAWYNGTIEREYLIFPCEEWGEYWDPEAQQIHNILRWDLYKYGKMPNEICKQMNEDIQGKVVYCDGGHYDLHWLNQLFNASSYKLGFPLMSRTVDSPEIVAHRALADAKWLWKGLNEQNFTS